MTAILFVCCLILIWWLIGTAFLATSEDTAKSRFWIFLAPSLGLSIHVIALFTLSRVGMPMSEAALPVLSVLIGLASLILSLRFSRWFSRDSCVYLSLIFLCAVPVAIPLALFGFEWLAFLNGDFAYYSLSAKRFLEYGYSELPAIGLAGSDRDRSLETWRLVNEIGHRAGIDILLASFIAITRLTAHQIFMPLLVALHAIAAVSSGALTFRATGRPAPAFITAALVSLSPMFSLQVTMQLMAQCAGLVFFIAFCAAYPKLQDAYKTHSVVAATFLVCGVMIAYSEILPFIFLYVLTTELFFLARRGRLAGFYARTKILGVLLISVLLLLSSYAFDAARFVVIVFKGSSSSGAMSSMDGLSLFPYVNLPGYPAVIFGWASLPGTSNFILILIGILFLFSILFLISTRVFMEDPAGFVCMIFVIIGAFLFLRGNDFGVFKISMFSQPFIISAVVSGLSLIVANQAIVVGIFFLYAVSIVPALSRNLERVSLDDRQAIFPFASSKEIGRQLRELDSYAKQVRPKALVATTLSRELAMIQAYYFTGIPFCWMSQNCFGSDGVDAFADRFIKSTTKGGRGNAIQGPSSLFFRSDSKGYELDDIWVLGLTGEFSPINRSTAGIGYRVRLEPVRALSNYLVFQNHRFSTSYVSDGWRDGSVGIWLVERDPWFPDTIMAAVGRYHIYQVINPVQNSQLLLSVTANGRPQDGFRLPTPVVVGNKSLTLPVVGRGSARVLSDPIEVAQVGTNSYVGIDFGRDGSFFNRTFTPGWFSRLTARADVRRSVVFLRDVSLVTRNSRDDRRAPKRVVDFPGALADSGFLYSGIFEDGWIAEQAYVVLEVEQEKGTLILRLRGEIPSINGRIFATQVSISINDETVYANRRSSGWVDLSVPVLPRMTSNGSLKISVSCDAVQVLPGGDDRPVCLKLNRIEMLEGPKHIGQVGK